MKYTKEDFDNWKKEFGFKILDRTLITEQTTGGIRTFWFVKGLDVGVTATIFLLRSKYRWLTGSLLALKAIESLTTLAVMRADELRLKKQLTDAVLGSKKPMTAAPPVAKKKEELN